jgi:hypothetical protein
MRIRELEKQYDGLQQTNWQLKNLIEEKDYLL